MSSSLGILSLIEQRDCVNYENISKIDIVFLTILLGALINSVVGLAQWQGVEQGMFMYPSKGRVYGNIAQPNQLATLLLMALVSLLYFDINKKIRLWRLWYFLLSISGNPYIGSQSPYCSIGQFSLNGRIYPISSVEVLRENFQD